MNFRKLRFCRAEAEFFENKAINFCLAVCLRIQRADSVSLPQCTPSAGGVGWWRPKGRRMRCSFAVFPLDTYAKANAIPAYHQKRIAKSKFP